MCSVFIWLSYKCQKYTHELRYRFVQKKESKEVLNGSRDALWQDDVTLQMVQNIYFKGYSFNIIVEAKTKQRQP